MRVLLIAGGWSSERKVSLSGAESIRRALAELGHEVTDADPSFHLAQLPEMARKAEFAFINLHGAPGEDGLIQSMLEGAGCPYQGSGPGPSLLTLNKAASKSVFADAGLPTPDWELVTEAPGPGWTSRIKPPVFVKPNQGGSSLGMAMIDKPGEIGPAAAGIIDCGDSCLVEELVPGQEVTCAILGRDAMPLILIRPKAAAFFDYESKYVAGAAEEICPAPIDEEIAEKIRRHSLKAHEVLGLSGYSRADFMVAGNEPMLLEVNTLPGMTPTSLVPRAAAAMGLDFAALIERLISLGLEEDQKRRKS
jgi:D-alanine-D-alanine ligase